MFDMFSMMNKVKEVQAKVQEVQGRLGKMTVTGEAGAGLVRANASGHKKIVSLEIDDTLLQDKQMLNDLIVAAVNKALEEAEELSKSEIQRETQGMMPNIPGLDLSNFGM